MTRSMAAPTSVCGPDGGGGGGGGGGRGRGRGGGGGGIFGLLASNDAAAT